MAFAGQERPLPARARVAVPEGVQTMAFSGGTSLRLRQYANPPLSIRVTWRMNRLLLAAARLRPVPLLVQQEVGEGETRELATLDVVAWPQTQHAMGRKKHGGRQRQWAHQLPPPAHTLHAAHLWHNLM